MSTGEPHWIVTNREDGTNVNGWHWVEKDCIHWIEGRVGEKVPGAVLGETGVTIDAKGTSVTGEATANNRRGKTIFLYELKVTARWHKAPAAEGGEKAAEGTITFPYIGDDNEDEKWDVEVSCTNKSVVGRSAAEDAEFYVRKQAAPLLEKIIRECLDSMKEHFSASHKACGNTTPSVAPPVSDYTQQKSAIASSIASSVTSSNKSSAPKTSATAAEYAGAHVEMVEKFSLTSPKELYELILDEGRMSVVAGKAKIERTIGGKFSLFDGAVTGVFVDLVSGQKIVEKWRFSSWPQDRYSLVTITLEEKKGKTVLTLKQDGVPPEDLERTQQGWKNNIWERMKVIFGYGSISL